MLKNNGHMQDNERTRRIIGHLDMDAFFASIEERDNPRFKDRPLVVGADPKSGAGRGVVSTANYAARAYGIHSALPISTAWKFSEEARRKGLPPAVFLGVDMKKYGEASERVMSILRAHAPHIEEASVDEAYFDLSSANSYEKAADIAREIKREIKKKERLTASIGIGPNKLVAKIASDAQKPDGLTIVREEDAETFIEPMPVRKIPGVGPKTEMRFKAMGVVTVKDAKTLSLGELQKMMGKWGTELYEKLRGRDDAPLVEVWEAKSIGEQETFEYDTGDTNFLREHLAAIAKGVFDRFVRSGFVSFRSVTITVRFADFTTKTRSATLSAPASDERTIQFQALRLFFPFLDRRENPSRKPIRLLGVRVEKLETEGRKPPPILI
ncbi:MAG TPA: DNA polymerase IV [Candidatus Paceibacterota bacterium]|nr:DNA polymerase IV [Candidatus Paceibacterota bacterium]